MSDENEQTFFATPVGRLVIFLIIVGIIVLMGLLVRGTGSGNTRNYRSNNNYFKAGQVPPSLAGYI